MIQEHILHIKITARDDLDKVQLEINIEASLPLFKHKRYHPAGFETTSISNKTRFFATPKAVERKLRRVLLKAQKRYLQIEEIRKQPVETRMVNLTHKL